MKIRSTAGRGLIALVALLLAATAVLAASPSADPSASATASASTTASASPSASPSSSVSPSAPESPAAAPGASPSVPVSPAAAPSAGSKPKASEQPEGAEAPEAPEAAEKAGEDGDGPPSADQVARIVAKLNDAGISATAAQVQDLAGKVGVGGAVRVFAFAEASGKTPAQILAMRDAGKGWGQIKHELNLSIGPGIGWIMGNGHGQGKEKGPKK
jgi:hypothetical protein